MSDNTAQQDLIIRPARCDDVPAMAALINGWAERGLMLHRSMAELYEQVRAFAVVTSEDAGLLGVCGLRVMWGNLAEVFALAVSARAQGRGVGRQLVGAMVDEARRLRVRRLFALTYQQGFFEKCGFQVIDRRRLPLKVWSECSRCAKRHACDEIAMQCTLADVEDLCPPVPTPGIQYEVPSVARWLSRPESVEE